MKKRFAAAAGSGSGFRRSLGALALMLSCGVFAAFSALPVPALAGPPPGMHHPGPGFGGPGHRPGFRPGPPPPPPRYHRGWHPRPWYRSCDCYGPTIPVDTILGAELYRSSTPRYVEVPVQTVPVTPSTSYAAAAPAASGAAGSGSYPWYWCSSEQGYFPTVRSCPLGWETVMGTSSTTPPAPPAP